MLQRDAIDLIYLTTTWDYNSTVLNVSLESHPVSNKVTRETWSANISKLQKLNKEILSLEHPADNEKFSQHNIGARSTVPYEELSVAFYWSVQIFCQKWSQSWLLAFLAKLLINNSFSNFIIVRLHKVETTVRRANWAIFWRSHKAPSYYLISSSGSTLIYSVLTAAFLSFLLFPTLTRPITDPLFIHNHPLFLKTASSSITAPISSTHTLV